MKPSFADLIQASEVPVLVDFYADWCAPCKAIAPELEKLAKDWEGKIKVIKVNVDNNPNLSQQMNIRSIPTLILYKGGNVVWRQTGGASAEQLKQTLNPIL